MIPQAFIQELLSRVDVVDVVGRYVQLRKAGANFLGLCPFHGEKSPSFTVSPTKQFYHCFGCGANGTAVGFLMEHAGLSFPEAVRELAQSVGLTVPQEGGRDQAASPRRDPDLLALMEQLARFYKSRLKDSPRAIDYLKRRGLTGETAARFGIGYAPAGWRSLEAAVADYMAPELLATGMVIDSGEPGGDHAAGQGSAIAQAPAARPAAGAGDSAAPVTSTASTPPGPAPRRKRYDRFRDRVMFPIRNARGQVIGFGGRVIDQGEPKYMNSPETTLFSKGRELYGLYEARDALRQTNCAVVVEGYMDVVMLAQHGVKHAVATLGTATTADHVRKLLRQVDRVVFAFDGDAAGRRAAWRALEACLPMVADTKRLDFLFLPPEHDPDSYVREHGPQGFAGLLDQALSLSAFMLHELGARVDLEQAEGRARLLAEARPLLLALPPAALRMQLVHRVAEVARVSTSELQEFLQQAGHDGRSRMPAAGWQGAEGPGGQGDGFDADRREEGRDRGDGRGGRSSWQSPPQGRSSGGRPPWDGAADGAWSGQGAGDDGRGGWGGGGEYRSGGGGFRSRGDRGKEPSGKGFRGGKDFRGPRRGEWSRDEAPRMRVAARPPELLRRVKLLTALHPALAVDPVDPQFLAVDLLDWLTLLRGLPAGASFAVICESLRPGHPALVAALERDAAAERVLIAEMGLEDARLEFEGALQQLRSQGVRKEIDALIARGLADQDDRRRLQELQLLQASKVKA